MRVDLDEFDHGVFAGHDFHMNMRVAAIAITRELRAARECEYILRDMTEAVEDQQYLDEEWQLARSALNAYELVTTGKITSKPPKEV